MYNEVVNFLVLANFKTLVANMRVKESVDNPNFLKKFL